jgi:hypothetical protein
VGLEWREGGHLFKKSVKCLLVAHILLGSTPLSQNEVEAQVSLLRQELEPVLGCTIGHVDCKVSNDL